MSFTLVSQTVDGLMGVRPDAAHRALSTVTVRHDGSTESTLTNTSASGAYSWTARFVGSHTAITANGASQPVRTKVVDGITYTCATVTVSAGQTTVVQVTG